GRTAITTLLAGVALILTACGGSQQRPQQRPRQEPAVERAGATVVPASQSTADAADARTPWSFTGSWTATFGHDASFDLVLVQNGTRLTGRHCAVTEHARRVDCAMDEDGDPDTTAISIEGTVQGESAEITFKSSYGLNDKGEPVT